MKYTLDIPRYLMPEIRRKLGPNGGATPWYAKSSDIRAVRLEACNEMRKHTGFEPQVSKVTISIDAAYRGAGSADEDNVWAMFKPARDGIADALFPKVTFAKRDNLIRMGKCKLREERKSPYFHVEVEVD